MKPKESNKDRAAKKAASLGMKITVNKELDKLSNKVLFPEKLEQANKILANTKFRYVK
jgi:hypothetical protein